MSPLGNSLYADSRTERFKTKAAELETALQEQKSNPLMKLFGELLHARREVHKEKMVDRDDPELRGACKELRSLLRLLSVL